MGCTADMFVIIQQSKPRGNVPDGMKVSFSKDSSGSPSPIGPVLTIGDFTFWPMSYMDNRMSFGMVMYDPKWGVGATAEKQGARYLYKITIDESASTITFWGQSDAKVTMSFDDICSMLVM